MSPMIAIELIPGRSPSLIASIASGRAASHRDAPNDRYISIRSRRSTTLERNVFSAIAIDVMTFPITMPNVGINSLEAYQGVAPIANILPKTLIDPALDASPRKTV